MRIASILFTLLLFLVSNLPSAAQSGKDNLLTKHDNKYWEETVLKFRALGIFSPKETENKSHYKNGYGGAFSIQFPAGRVVSWYAELAIGAIRHIEWETSTPNPYLKSDKNEPLIIIQAGIRTYPNRAEFPVYLKSGLAMSFPYPTFIAGLGYDFNLSDKFSIYPETELYYSGNKSSTRYSFSLGLSLFH